MVTFFTVLSQMTNSYFLSVTVHMVTFLIIIMLYLQPKVGLHDYMFMSHTESYYYYTRKTVKYTKVV